MPAMKCPECGAGASRVVDSRLTVRRQEVRRRRVCPKDHRFTTIEHVVEGHPLSVPKLSEAQVYGIALQLREQLDGVLRGAWQYVMNRKLPPPQNRRTT